MPEFETLLYRSDDAIATITLNTIVPPMPDEGLASTRTHSISSRRPNAGRAGRGRTPHRRPDPSHIIYP